MEDGIVSRAGCIHDLAVRRSLFDLLDPVHGCLYHVAVLIQHGHDVGDVGDPGKEDQVLDQGKLLLVKPAGVSHHRFPGNGASGVPFEGISVPGLVGVDHCQGVRAFPSGRVVVRDQYRDSLAFRIPDGSQSVVPLVGRQDGLDAEPVRFKLAAHGQDSGRGHAVPVGHGWDVNPVAEPEHGKGCCQDDGPADPVRVVVPVNDQDRRRVPVLFLFQFP